MNTYKLSNVSLDDFRDFLRDKGCENVQSGNTGHEKWNKAGMTRPVILQTHISPIPEFIIRNNLRNLGLTATDFKNWQKGRNKK